MSLCPKSIRFSTAVFRSRAVPGVVLGAIAIALALGGCERKQAFSNGPVQPPTTAEIAKSAKVALADHLTKNGAQMFGTYWCPYCKRQKELFGDAEKYVPIVECDPKGDHPQPQVCDQAGISSYPTWKINGKLYRGLRSLSELAALSGYSGATNFEP